MAAHADLTPDQQQELAMRFRPLIKTTLNGSQDEPFHPVSWSWFVENTQVWNNSTSSWAPLGYLVQKTNPNIILTLPNASMGLHALTYPNVPLPDPGYQLRFFDTSLRAGEPWSSVIQNGDGIFAHVEEIPGTNQVNIEYTITWAYNAAIWSNHDGDMTTVIAVYDRDADLLVRVSYSIHGCGLESYRIASPTTVGFTHLPGLDQNMNSISTPVASLNLGTSSDAAVVHSGLCDNGWNNSEAVVYLAQDPMTLRYEHIVIYAEDGSHEPWPNNTGSIYTVPAHSGNGVSFLPAKLAMLGTVAAPNSAAYDTFLFWNGKWGADPQSIMMHKSWFWPQGRAANKFLIPANRFTDKDPYDSTSGLGWPPKPENNHGAVVLYVAPVPVTDQSLAIINNTVLPFPGLLAALSFVPRNGVLALGSGSYPTNTTIHRPMQLVARGGAAILGTRPLAAIASQPIAPRH